jgi:hypothetical protein
LGKAIVDIIEKNMGIEGVNDRAVVDSTPQFSIPMILHETIYGMFRDGVASHTQVQAV